MKRLSLVIAAMLVFTVSGSNAQSRETRSVSMTDAYHSITVAGTQNVHFETGPGGDPITVIGKGEDLDKMRIYVQNGTLIITTKKGARIRSGIDVYLKNPTLKKASVSGTGSINISGKLDDDENNFSVSGTGTINVASVDCRKLVCTVSGTGSIQCPKNNAQTVSATTSGTGSINLSGVTATTVEGRASGTGSVSFSGTADHGKYNSSGTGQVNARDLSATDVDATTSGTGDVNCRCSGSFSGRASGTGRVNLWGDPQNVDFKGTQSKLVRK